MKCGELYTYDIDGRIQSIRKERGYYVCLVVPVLELIHLEEHTFQILKCTIENNMERLEKWLAKHYQLSNKQIRVSISSIQKELVSVCLLPKKHAKPSKRAPSGN
ncbi:MAG: hypothetical protein ABH871_08690 [Pseudomonadota bacterium]